MAAPPLPNSDIPGKVPLPLGSSTPRPTASRASSFPKPGSSAQAGPSTEPLQRANSRSSLVHAQTALRRIATHETGTGVEAHDGEEEDRLHTHDEHEHEHDHDHDHDSEESHSHGETSGEKAPRDEEEKIGLSEPPDKASKSKRAKKEVQLQDQTNLLPTRQVILVFVGLCAALFGSLLDQTM